MHEIFTMMLAVYDRAALMLICLFFLIRLRLFRELLHKSAHTPKELLAVTAIFSLFALFSTWSGVPVEGSLVNVRIIAVMSGGILFGPWVGAIVGAIAGVHRYLIDIDGVTAVPCFITSIVAGLLSGLINRKVAREQRWKIGILAGMMCETLTMILLVVFAFYVTLPALILGLFLGFRYQISGPDLEDDTINGVMDSMADTAAGVGRQVMDELRTQHEKYQKRKNRPDGQDRGDQGE